MSFSGVVLAGGRSRRMGTDKAFVAVGGRPLVTVAARALAGAGASTVEAIGGDRRRLAALGIATRPDDWPGEGPLGALVTALERARSEIVVVLTCDLVRIDARDVRRLVDVLCGAPATALVVAPTSEGHPQLLTAAWRRQAAPPLSAAFGAGERSVRRAVATAGLAWVETEGIEDSHLVDLDSPDDVAAAMGDAYPGPPMGIPEIDVSTAAARRADGAAVLDVRNPDEYEAGHVPGAVLVPLGELAGRLHEVPESADLLVICRSGARSMRAAELLGTHGVEATNIAGGTLAWIDAGFEVVTGDEPG